MSRQKSQGFSLVEILIVVAITAALATVVIPQFKGSIDDTKLSTAEFNLGHLRSVIQAFRAQHAGRNPAFPVGATTIGVLIKETDASGTVTSGGGLGPYLTDLPENPFTGTATVKAVATPGAPPVVAEVTAGDMGGWIYDSATGGLWLDSNTRGEFAW